MRSYCTCVPTNFTQTIVFKRRNHRWRHLRCISPLNLNFQNAALQKLQQIEFCAGLRSFVTVAQRYTGGTTRSSIRSSTPAAWSRSNKSGRLVAATSASNCLATFSNVAMKNSSPGWTLARSIDHASRGMIQRIDDGTTPCTKQPQAGVDTRLSGADDDVATMWSAELRELVQRQAPGGR